MKEVKFDFAYMFFYSERPKTLAERKYEDNVPEDTKRARLQKVIDLQRKHATESNESCIGKTVKVLIESTSKKSNLDFSGRNDENCKVVFLNFLSFASENKATQVASKLPAELITFIAKGTNLSSAWKKAQDSGIKYDRPPARSNLEGNASK